MLDVTPYLTEEARQASWLTAFHTTMGTGMSRLDISRSYLTWKGVRVVKLPGDFQLYQMAIWATKPDYIIEAGTKYGGSALFFADMLDLTGKGQVITIDTVKREDFPTHLRLRYITGSSIDRAVFNELEKEVRGKKVMVVLDSAHNRIHVKRELHLYYRLVGKGLFLVVEDAYDRDGKLGGPGQAIDWFIKSRRGWIVTDMDKKIINTITRGGWLTRSGK